MDSLAGAVGRPAWAELAVTDLAVASAFYGPLLGWQFQPGADGQTTALTAWVDRRPVASLLHPQEADYDVLWTVYFHARDLVAVVEAAAREGATILVPQVSVTGFGLTAERPALDDGPSLMPWYFPGSDLGELATMAVLADPSGAAVGLWRWRGRSEADDPAVGSAVGADHFSDDPAGAAAAIGALPGFDLLGQVGAAFRPAPRGLPAPLWVPAFGVADLAAATRRAVPLGGRVTVKSGHDGLRALLTGPLGELFCLEEVPSAP
jgi:predicted enzyme related to lactoylglutathione lyase